MTPSMIDLVYIAFEIELIDENEIMYYESAGLWIIIPYSSRVNFDHYIPPE